MATTNYNCSACEELRQDVPSLICNGLDEDMCLSLSNDTGLVPSSGNDDCHDLNNLNDCLVGNMEHEVDMHEVCDWKTFTKQFIGNLWTVLKAMICAICGIWTNIHSLWDKINEILNNLDKLECILEYLSGSRDIATVLSADSFVAGSGVDFNRSGTAIVKPNVIVAGSTYTIGASIRVNLSGTRWGSLGMNNSGSVISGNTINTPSGNYMLFLIKIPNSVIPSNSLISCVGQFTNSACGDIFAQVIGEGGEYAGQWGRGESGTANVPSGYTYIRVSLSSLTTWGVEVGDDWADVTIRATGLALTNVDGISC